VIFTVKLAALPAVSTMGFGVTAHPACAGAPVHDMETLPEYAAPGVSCRLYVAVCPALTDAANAAAGLLSTNAGLGVPVTEIVCGEFAASSAMEILSERVPLATSGEKLTAMLQLALGARVAAQGFA
jgi:hypothetical protein